MCSTLILQTPTPKVVVYFFLSVCLFVFSVKVRSINVKLNCKLLMTFQFCERFWCSLYFRDGVEEEKRRNGLGFLHKIKPFDFSQHVKSLPRALNGKLSLSHERHDIIYFYNSQKYWSFWSLISSSCHNYKQQLYNWW